MGSCTFPTENINQERNHRKQEHTKIMHFKTFGYPFVGSSSEFQPDVETQQHTLPLPEQLPHLPSSSSPPFLQNPSLSRLLPSRQTRRELEIHSATASNLPSRPSAAIPNISRFLPPRFSIARIWRILQPPNPGLPCRVQSPRSPMLERIA